MASLLARWRKRPAVALAEALEAELSTVEAAAPPVDQAAWVKAARKLGAEADAAALAPLLTSLQAKKLADTVERFKALKGALPDPRIAAAFATFVKAVPFTSDTSKPSWQALLPVVEAAGDPRLIAWLTEARASVSVRPLFQTWFVRRLDETIAGLHARFPDGAPALDAATQEKVRAALPGKKAPRAGKQSAQSLFAAVYAAPHDTSARLVLADALQELGDPRGEFIALQCANPADKKAKALSKQHGKAWVVPLQGWLGSDVRFSRGFPSEVTLKLRNDQDARAAENAPEWSTIEVMHVANPAGGSSVNEPASQMFPRALRSLRELYGLRESGIDRLLEVAPWVRLRALGFVPGSVSDEAAARCLAAPLADEVKALHFVPFAAAKARLGQIERWVVRAALTDDFMTAVRDHPRLVVEQEPMPTVSGMSESATLSHADGGVALTLTLHRFAHRNPLFDFTGAAEQAKSVARSVDSLIEALRPVVNHPMVTELTYERDQLKPELLDAAALERGLAGLKALRAPRTLRRSDFSALEG